MTTTGTTREAAIRAARSWLGTPYRHQASVRGVGADCLGLLRGVWRTLYGREPETPPGYTRDWAETGDAEPLIAAARRHLVEIDVAEAQPGDVLVFRWQRSMAAKHVAILSAPASIIHAVEGAAVAEVAVTPWWRRRVAAAFRFPETT